MTPITLSRRTLVAGLSAALLPVATRAQTSGLLVHSWQPPRGISGVSAIELDDDGAGFHMLTDRARLVRGGFDRDPSGRIVAVEVQAVTDLRDVDGAPYRGRRADSEGLAIAPDGTVFVSFEGGHRTRVARFDTPQSAAVDLPVHPRFHEGLDGARTLEALAIDGRGALYTLPQDDRGGVFEMFRYDGGQWQIVGTVPQRDQLRPAGADFGPDGAMYLLEQRQARLGVRNRISRIEPGRWEAPRTLVDFETGVTGNYEGIAISLAPSGTLRATLVSDNNLFSRMRTEIAEVLLP